MEKILEQIGMLGIVPVVKIEDASKAEGLAGALCRGGLPVAEVTFRTDAAEEAIGRMCRAYPEMLVGAGTVLTPDQADRAMAAGARFIVSPGLNPAVVAHCKEKGYPVVPGICTPGEIETALSFGLEVVKFFPAEAAGGLPMIKAMSAPYGKLKFMPTGGIGPKNLAEYLKNEKVLACGGSWMVPGDLLAADDFAGIEKLAREAVQLMLNFEVGHVGINPVGGQSAVAVADRLFDVFGFEKKEGKGSVFSSPEIELMKEKGIGSAGHLAVLTDNIDRAYAYLSRLGVEFMEDSRLFDGKGRMARIFLKEEFMGFAIHLLQRK